jgi:aspartyl-tRNA(Asn)/glutamyl-tRNA(Gln) amidotransferase subunit A
MHSRTLAQLADDLRSGRCSSSEIIQHFLDRIERHGPALNAFITVTGELALAAAAAADARRAKGKRGPLDGLPLVHKDIFCTQGVKTSCGSRMLDNFASPYNATVVERLDVAGMVMLGKTNMDEFAMGSSNETSFYGAVRNPWDLEKVPGGSSGGSAAAVAGGLAPAATGTDTGGSIRQPAALCGLTGLKPTYGRVSRYGMVAFASSLDQAGVLTLSAEDAALMLQAMAGYDPRDSTCLTDPVPDYQAELSGSIQGLRVGVPTNFFDAGLDAENRQQVEAALQVLQSQGAELVSMELANLHLSVPVYYVVAPAEASSNLSRFDGIRFGHRADEVEDLLSLYMRTRGEGFGAEVKRRILTGTYVLSAGYYDAYYLKAQQVRQLISQSFTDAFASVDVIAGPTTPTPAFPLGQKTNDPVAMYLNDIYTIGANLAGLPAVSIPCGEVGGLPVGLQLIGPHLAEAQLLKVAHRFQSETDFHQRAAPMRGSA